MKEKEGREGREEKRREEAEEQGGLIRCLGGFTEAWAVSGKLQCYY